MLRLRDLEDGKYICGDSEKPLLPPDDFDMRKFERGRQFFRDHIFGCINAMFFSLIIGMSVPELLNALVFTGESSTPQKAQKRYLQTFRHVALWHYGNVWDEYSEAHKSIVKVRNMHKKVRVQMEEHSKKNGKLFLSQYDMGVVQSGFMGCIVMYHEYFGIKCSAQDIDDYVYFWYGIGHLLGLEERYNICAYGASQAQSLCKEIEEIVVHNLKNPAPDFNFISNATISGFSGERRFLTILSFPVIHHLALEAMSRNREPLCVSDNIRCYLWKLLFLCTKSFPLFNNFVRTTVEKVFGLAFT